MNFGFTLLPANTTSFFLPCYHVVDSQVGCCGAAQQPRLTLVMAAIQLGYSTDREVLSDKTMAAARHNTCALTEGIDGMLLPCLFATGMEGWMKGQMERKDRGEEGRYISPVQPNHNLMPTNYNHIKKKVHLQQKQKQTW